MTDWFGNRSHERFIFRRVSYPGYLELENYESIIGGSLELSALSPVKVSGSLSFTGEEVPNDHDLVRVYYQFEDDNGDVSKNVLATMFFSVSEPVYRCAIVEGTMECSSVLVLLQRRKYGLPYTVQAGVNAVNKAVEIIKSLNLPVVATKSNYVLGSDHTFEPDDDYLTIVNWLLEAAGFSSAFVDPMGNVVVEPYIEPTEREARYVFRDDEQSIMLPEVSTPTDYQDTPNVVRLRHMKDSETIWASAVNVDPLSKASTVSRGYENTLTEDVSELEGSTQAQMVANLKTLALKKLIQNSAEIEKVTMTHCWLPIAPNDSVLVDYRLAGIKWRGAVTNAQIELTPAMPCVLSLRNFVRTGIKTTVEGGAL